MRVGGSSFVIRQITLHLSVEERASCPLKQGF